MSNIKTKNCFKKGKDWPEFSNWPHQELKKHQFVCLSLFPKSSSVCCLCVCTSYEHWVQGNNDFSVKEKTNDFEKGGIY